MSRINEAAAEGMSGVNRRTLLSSILPATAILALPSASVAAMTPTPIAELFRQWKATNDEAFPDNPLPSAQSAYERYRELQEAIANETPLTVADVARQFIVETDDGASEYRDAFWEKMKRLAGEA